MLVNPLDLCEWLVSVTMVSAVALVMCALLRNRAALRHGVLVATLMFIVCTPLLIWGMRLMHRPILTVRVNRVESIVPSAMKFVKEQSGSQAKTVAHSAAASTSGDDWREVFVVVESAWAGVAIILLAMRMLGWWRMWRLVRKAPQCGCVNDPRVRVAKEIAGPMSVGLVRPVVLLPEELVGRLSGSQIDEVLAHEFAHDKRGDHAVAVVQQIVGSVLWPHVLVHVVNRELNRAREELCDNEVLCRYDRADYAATLLRIAEWMRDRGAQSMPALGLIGRRGDFAKRVQNLLDERRVVMTHANRKSLLALWVAFLGIAVVGASIGVTYADAPQPAVAATTQPASDALEWHDISFQLGQQEFHQGDRVQISSVRCTAEQLGMGELMQVKGTYDLNSADEADLCLFMTATDGNGRGPIYPQQRISVKRGHGEFVLREPITCRGWPHVSFYDKQSGNNIGGVYFGYGEWLHGDATGVTDRIGK